MAHIGNLRDYKFRGDVDDIRGTSLYGRGDERLGKVVDVIFDHAGGYIQYLVVDTGGWLRGNRFLVPADRVNAHSGEDRDFTCDLTKEQIERFPEYKDSVIRNQDDWKNYESRYHQAIESDGGVMHREGSDHLITPEADQMPAASAVEGAEGVDFTPTRMAHRFTDTGVGSDKQRMRPAGIAARAEDTKTPGNSYDLEESAWREPDRALRNRRATDRKSSMHREMNTEPAEIDPVLNQEVKAFSPREDLGDVDVKTADATVDAAPSSGMAGDMNDNRIDATRPMAAQTPHADAGAPPRDMMGMEGENISQMGGSAYGSPEMQQPPAMNPSDPPSYRSGQDRMSRMHRPRMRRLQAFEETLRRNRVDITASCRSCGVEREDDKDKAA